jgi:hypothetical protein
MKNFKYFILFLSLITISEIAISNDANAITACALNGDDKIVKATLPSSGCIAVGKTSAYEITVKEIHLCKSLPAKPTSTTPSDLSDCENVFLNAAGNSVSFAAGEDVTLTGTFKRPSNGTYPYAFIKLVNTWGITAAVEFDSSMDGMEDGSGVFCRTVAETSGTHQQSGSHEESVCSSTYVAPGKFTETTAQFGDVGGGNPFRPCAVDGVVAEASACTNTGNGNIYLVQSNDKLATASSNVAAIHGILRPTTSLKVSANTTAITTKFDVTNGSALAATNGGASVYIGLGPFDISIAVE